MKILYIGDNRNRENWGCRATSKALRDLIAEQHDIIYTIYGDISQNIIPIFHYTSINNKIKMKILILNRILTRLFDYICSDVDKSIKRFKSLAKKYTPYKIILEKINNCDAIVLNGEGSFIFTKPYRRESIFYLVILKIAQSLNKKTYCLNAMFSDCPRSGRNQYTLSQAVAVFSQCTLLTVREKESYDYLKHASQQINVKYVPDALFDWIKYDSYISELLFLPKSLIPFPERDEHWDSFDFLEPYICVSGSSSAAWTQDDACRGYIVLVEALKILKYKLYIVPTCTGDNFLYKVAKQINVPVVPSNINILGGMAVLANAKVFISGRWHPSIMASLGGTPCVFLGSNSHKTRSLQKIMEYETIMEYNAIPNQTDVNLIVDDVRRYLGMGELLRKKIKDRAKKISELVSLQNMFTPTPPPPTTIRICGQYQICLSGMEKDYAA